MNAQAAEAFVFAGEEKQRTRYAPSRAEGVRLRSCSDEARPDAVHYEEGIDYEVDYDGGWIRRTANSRIPDWDYHALRGVRDFDHTLYADYSNRNYTVYGSYLYEAAGEEEVAVGGGLGGELAGFLRKLEAGREVVFAVLGDSISAGGEASEERFAFYGRLAFRLEARYPGSRVRIENRAIGGETSEGGAGRVSMDVVPLRPDLVTIGYGMNDQNKYDHGNGVPLGEYERNVRYMVEEIRRGCDADVVLVTPCEPNPLWKHTSGTIGEYADALRRLGGELGVGVADAHAVWVRELDAGKSPESLLLNNINHPNDYGHGLYGEALSALFRIS